MAENKRFYWLKLKEDFFDDETIKFIEEQENGEKYALFYLKLCVKSIKTSGLLIRLVGETLLPYNAKALSNLTNTDIDTVNNAMNLFNKLGIVQTLESGELYLSQVKELVGSETNKASLMRKSRAKKKRLTTRGGNNVTRMLLECYPDIDIDIEKDIDIDMYNIKKTSISDDIESKEKEKSPPKSPKGESVSETKKINDLIKDLPKELQEVVQQFVKMRKAIKAPVTEYSLRLIIKKAKKLGGDDISVVEQIIQQSIENSWRGVFPLKTQTREISFMDIE